MSSCDLPQEAEHAHRAGEKMSDLEVLVSEMENALRVGDIGDDLASTKQLSKKHQVDIGFFFQVSV